MHRKLTVAITSILMTLVMAVPAIAADYTVRSGDTLSRIAAAHDVDGGWRALYDANRDTIANPNLIRVGQVLELPDGSSRAARAERASRSSSRSSVGEAIVAAARSQIGTPYRYGGNSPSGFDCSGLTSWAYRQAGVDIPRTSTAQWSAGTRVSDPQPGDIIAYYSPVSHVAIYAGNGKMIVASRPGKPVREAPVYSSGLRGYVRFR